ncbi:MAG: tRNA 2-thiouridine(34) synthase MnmA [Spirochaetaceae bacterium]|nr:tRNA 2-thiouridine(34) synthase MnmA [Spirochaetaceae bacterium]
MANKNITVAVGMSGGVDSSVAAAILKKEGYKVIGITMEIWDGAIEVQESRKHACYGPGEEEDIEEATKVCAQLNIPYHVFDLTKEYKEHVLEYFREEYLAGRTPNPCVVCNHRLKFGFLIEKAREAGLEFDFFATGHYAQINEDKGKYFLKKAKDLSKDQTYFLKSLSSEQLKFIMFPLGELMKTEVREIAEDLKLVVADRIESQDFIAGGDYSPLFNDGEIIPGDIVNEKGEILGRHKGIIHYTVGQRKGLGLSHPTPLYVLRVDAGKNKVIVTDKESLFFKGLIASDINLNLPGAFDKPIRIKARIRQRHTEADAEISLLEGGRVKVVFDIPQLSVTPGQSVVFYNNDIVLGGGIIESPL